MYTSFQKLVYSVLITENMHVYPFIDIIINGQCFLHKSVV